MGLASSFLLQLNLSFLINHGLIVLVLWPFRLETVHIRGGKIFVLQSLSPIFIQLEIVAGDTFRRAKRAFIKRKCANFLGSPTDKSFWPLAKNISSNFCKCHFSSSSFSSQVSYVFACDYI